MNVKSDGGSRQHHYTTKSITIPYVPTRQVPWPSRGRVRKPMPEGMRNKHPQEPAAPSPPPHAPRSGCTWSPASVLKYVPRAPAVTLPRAPGGRRQRRGGGHRGGGQGFGGIIAPRARNFSFLVLLLPNLL